MYTTALGIFFTERTLFKGIATVLFGETGELSQPESEIQVGFFYLVRLTVSTCKTNIQTNSCTDIYTANVYRDLQGSAGTLQSVNITGIPPPPPRRVPVNPCKHLQYSFDLSQSDSGYQVGRANFKICTLLCIYIPQLLMVLSYIA